MFKELIGKRSIPAKNIVERGAVKKFVEAIGDPAPIYVNEEAGKASRYGRNIAPPTFPITLEYGMVDELVLPTKGLIHGEQKFHYKRPLFVGEEVYGVTAIKNYYERTGSFGKMGFLVIERQGTDAQGELIYTEEQIIIINEAARKEMPV